MAVHHGDGKDCAVLARVGVGGGCECSALRAAGFSLRSSAGYAEPSACWKWTVSCIGLRHLLLGEAEHALGCRIHQRDPAVGILRVQPLVDAVEHRLAELGLGVLVGDVDRDRSDPDQVTPNDDGIEARQERRRVP